MATIDQAIGAAQALELEAIRIHQQWCTRVRNNRSTCSECMDACPHGAVLAFENKVAIDRDACTGCGACAAACPTGALACANPTHGQLAEQIERIALENHQLAFCCERSGLHQHDDARFVGVGCLAQLDEALVAHAATCGVKAIALVSSGCGACPNSAEHLIESLISRCSELFSFWGLEAKLMHKTQPDIHHVTTDPGQRREAFQDLASDARLIALRAMEQSLPGSKGDRPETLAEMLASNDGGLPRQVPPRTTMLLNDLFSLDCRPTKPWATRLFAQVRIDKNACTRCGKCAFFCPTGALQFHGQPAKPAVMGVAPQAEESFHTFRACDCVNCGLCADACPAHALTLENVKSKDLFELEPQSPYLGD